MQLKETVVGIDLGTSNSVCYFFRNNQYESLAITAQSPLLPSVVEYRKEFVIGESAKKASNNPNYYVLQNTKRVLGSNYDNDKVSDVPGLCNMPMSRAPNDTVQFVDEADGTIRTPVSVSTDNLKDLIKRMKRTTEMKISRFVVTVPADFKQEQRLATREAIRDVGFNDSEFRILNEPTAAALSYFVDNPVRAENIIVYDVGGGTFDCTVIRIENNHFCILAHDGDEGIGGVLFDKILFDYVMNCCKKQYGKSPLLNEVVLKCVCLFNELWRERVKMMILEC